MKQDKHFRLCVIGAFALLFLANSNCTYVKHEKDEKYTHVKVLKPPQIVNAGSPSVRVAGAPRNTNGSKPRIVSADFFAHISDGDIERWCSIDDLLIDKNNNLWVNYSVTEETKKDNGEHYWRVIEAGVCCCSEGKDYKVYSSKEGLCDDVVHCMFGDSIGNIWFGTRNGVTRFDGQNFTTYDTTQGLLNNYVCCIAEDRNRNLWFGTVNGASYFNGKYFMNYTKEEGLIGGNVLGLVEDNDGDIWFGTQGNGAICFNGKSFTIYTTDQGLPSNGFFFRQSGSKAMLKARNGNLWFRTYSGAVCQFDGNKFITYDTTAGLNNFIECMAEDREGNMWFGSEKCIIKYDGKKFAFYDIPFGTKDSEVSSIVLDKKGDLLFGTSKSGIIRYDGKAFTNFFSKG